MTRSRLRLIGIAVAAFGVLYLDSRAGAAIGRPLGETPEFSSGGLAVPVATARGIEQVPQRDYAERTNSLGHLPTKSREYVFGRTIPVPLTDREGRIQVLGAGPELSPLPALGASAAATQTTRAHPPRAAKLDQKKKRQTEAKTKKKNVPQDANFRPADSH